MLDYLARRALGALATLIVVITVVFFATRLSGNAMDYLLPPGIDPATKEAMIQHFGLDQSLWLQFSRFIEGLVRGDAGISLFERRPVTTIYAERLPNTITLFAYALALARTGQKNEARTLLERLPPASLTIAEADLIKRALDE